MMFPQHADHVFFADMGIALGRRNRRMSEKLLDHPNIHAIAEKQRSHRMPQHVRSNVRFSANDGAPTDGNRHRFRTRKARPLRPLVTVIPSAYESGLTNN